MADSTLQILAKPTIPKFVIVGLILAIVSLIPVYDSPFDWETGTHQTVMLYGLPLPVKWTGTVGFADVRNPFAIVVNEIFWYFVVSGFIVIRNRIKKDQDGPHPFS